jgi:hypothetical protein
VVFFHPQAEAEEEMIYSVWNQPERKYHYFQTPEKERRVNSPRPTHIPWHQLGTSAHRAAWPLPSNATFVGRGDHARGRVAKPSSLGLVDVDWNLMKIALAALSALLVYKYVLKAK